MFASWHVDQGEEPAVAPIRVQGAEQRNKRSRHTCDLCDKLIIGDLEWTGEGLVESLPKKKPDVSKIAIFCSSPQV